MTSMQLSRSQWTIVLLIAAVQFVNILDFVMVMPLGPDFARALDIPESKLGLLSGSYTIAACISGLVGSVFLDRFDRRAALCVSLAGLVVGTAMGGFAFDLTSLMYARIVAGAFGGPATSLSFAIISDVIPSSLRGRAMGTVMGAFSLAAVIGVPSGLYLAEQFGWQAPFFATAGVGLLIAIGAWSFLPAMTHHLARGSKAVVFADVVKDPLVRGSLAMTAVVMAAGFILIPNIAAYVQLNLGFPREQLKYAYGFGGVASLVATQLGGRLVDRFGSFRTGTAGAAMFGAIVFSLFYMTWRSVAESTVIWGFVGFMFANGLRNVSYNTLASKVPDPSLRARFQSLQSAVQHLASGVAAAVSTALLTTSMVTGAADQSASEKTLEGMSVVAIVSMALTLAIPAMMLRVERGVRRRLVVG